MEKTVSSACNGSEGQDSVKNIDCDEQKDEYRSLCIRFTLTS